ncbi:LysM peptidoglycan-binding domain-containing protein [Spongiactinospora sp. TRM90649]|uniref:LysM peptidoglycan-binding domain-containing protein n=1 Tax=Spongiactinospora sp. TRM90649 TaxID=3031114 RepID=UPI0023F7B934|nr:LysM peptidoglycan-binding domain-containing protein [Spongiactinospora sp. TRM90649]MDF5759054.1 LysM peptidoglycan-binding domain-containing protein [Spongiactinospora sp. TRM90649]
MYRLRHPILSKLVAAAVLVALLTGMPAVLLAFFWPVELPTLDDLATPGEPLVRTLLIVVVWTCWALFAWSVLVELVGTIRDRPSRVRLPFQRLAAYLITALTVAATAPVAAPRGMVPVAAVAVSPAELPTRSAAVDEPRDAETGKPYLTYVVQPRDTLWTIADKQLGDAMRYPEIAALNQGRVMGDGQTFTTGDWLRPGWTLRLPADSAAAKKQSRAPGRTHTVARGETLWDIAERHLGDGHRYQEIFHLNKGRTQAGGMRLTDPGELEPGWRLILPERDSRKAEPLRHRAAPQSPVADPAPGEPLHREPHSAIKLPQVRPAVHEIVSPGPIPGPTPHAPRSCLRFGSR